MTQEDKELLLKYLCMALPYGVKISTPTIIGRQDEIRVATAIHKFKYYSSVCGDNFGWDNIEYIKPYLRPMSSMTEEEDKEISTLLNYEFYIDVDYGLSAEDDRHSVRLDLIQIYTNWLLKNHFDFMGLIPKNLAIEVTKENNPYKN